MWYNRGEMTGNGNGRRYNGDDRKAALLRLLLNSGNLTRTARELAMPRQTLRSWRDESQLAEFAALKLDASVPIDFAAEWAEVQLTAINRMTDLIPEAESLDEVTKAANVAHNAHLDHTKGRRGAAQISVNQDNRSITVVLREDEDVP